MFVENRISKSYSCTINNVRIHKTAKNCVTKSKPFPLTKLYKQETVALYPPRSRRYSAIATKNYIPPRTACDVFYRM